MGFKDIKRNYIISAAKDLFLASSIQEVTIKDVSKASGVGEATIYRYFSTKENLATEVSIALQKEIVASYIQLDALATGYQSIESFFNLFFNVYVSHPDYFRYLTRFDSLYLPTISGSEYPNALDRFKEFFLKSYQTGLRDGTVRPISNPEVFYYATTHSLLELCKKLSALDSALPQDKAINKEEEVKAVINVFLAYLKK
ncbi:MAG: TetR/AcrR family transcriptional regulator [Bacilli bacterium]|nr:TetR/AcrR family transcriptional regulator [Bacilli bacterium]